MTTPAIPGYRLERSLEPPHPHCTISDPVHAATDATGARVVVKLLHLGFPLRAAAEVAYVDAMARASSIVSPHAVRVLAAGVADVPWFAMEEVAGETLASVIERGVRATPAQTQSVLQQCASALEAARTAGCAPTLHVRHVMLTASGARLWNFGMWPWRGQAHDLAFGTYVGVGHILRHPNLTPREAQGLPVNDANACAQLALMAFAMLAGRYYWEADRDPTLPPMQLLMEVMAGPTTPASARTDAALPAGFDAWFARCVSGELADPGAAVRNMPLP